MGSDDHLSKGVIEWELWTANDTFTQNIVVAMHAPAPAPAANESRPAGGIFVFTGHACNSSWNPGATLSPSCSDKYEDNFRAAIFDRNLYWAQAAPEKEGVAPAPCTPLFPDASVQDNGRAGAPPPGAAGSSDSSGRTLAQWQVLGHDRQSLVADPLFRDAARGDYSLLPSSPALRRLGFVPIDLAKVGPDWSEAAVSDDKRYAIRDTR